MNKVNIALNEIDNDRREKISHFSRELRSSITIKEFKDILPYYNTTEVNLENSKLIAKTASFSESSKLLETNNKIDVELVEPNQSDKQKKCEDVLNKKENKFKKIALSPFRFIKKVFKKPNSEDKEKCINIDKNEEDDMPKKNNSSVVKDSVAIAPIVLAGINTVSNTHPLNSDIIPPNNSVDNTNNIQDNSRNFEPKKTIYVNAQTVEIIKNLLNKSNKVNRTGVNQYSNYYASTSGTYLALGSQVLGSGITIEGGVVDSSTENKTQYIGASKVIGDNLKRLRISAGVLSTINQLSPMINIDSSLTKSIKGGVLIRTKNDLTFAPKAFEVKKQQFEFSKPRLSFDGNTSISKSIDIPMTTSLIGFYGNAKYQWRPESSFEVSRVATGVTFQHDIYKQLNIAPFKKGPLDFSFIGRLGIANDGDPKNTGVVSELKLTPETAFSFQIKQLRNSITAAIEYSKGVFYGLSVTRMFGKSGELSAGCRVGETRNDTLGNFQNTTPNERSKSDCYVKFGW